MWGCLYYNNAKFSGSSFLQRYMRIHNHYHENQKIQIDISILIVDQRILNGPVYKYNDTSLIFK